VSTELLIHSNSGNDWVGNRADDAAMVCEHLLLRVIMCISCHQHTVNTRTCSKLLIRIFTVILGKANWSGMLMVRLLLFLQNLASSIYYLRVVDSIKRQRSY